MFLSSETDEGSPGAPGESPWENPDNDAIREILQNVRRIAVVGLSADPARPSNGVAAYLIESGYDVVPVNPNVKEVFGRRSFPALKDVDGAVDLVNIFRRPEFAPAHVDEAVAAGAQTVWLQETVVSLDAYQRAQAAGLRVIMDRCILKEHSRLF